MAWIIFGIISFLIGAVLIYPSFLSAEETSVGIAETAATIFVLWEFVGTVLFLITAGKMVINVLHIVTHQLVRKNKKRGDRLIEK